MVKFMLAEKFNKHKSFKWKNCWLMLLLLMTTCMLKAQNNCPLHMFVTATPGTCYSDCLITIDLRDGHGNPLDTALTDLTDIKYYCIDMSNQDTSYSILSSFNVRPGRYRIGVQAICHYSYSSLDSAYIMLDTCTEVQTTTSYVTPVLSNLIHEAEHELDFGVVHSLSCANTGRLQVRITGGSFPYHIQLCDASDQPIDTFVFADRMYSGNDINQYDYKDNYTLDSLAPGLYKIYFWDGCGYRMPVVNGKVDTAYLPYINQICWYYSPGNLKYYNIIRFAVKVTVPNMYYSDCLVENTEYRLIYPEIGGVRDTTAWKKLPHVSNEIQLRDTAYRATRYCDLFDSPIIFESRNNKCEDKHYTDTFSIKPWSNLQLGTHVTSDSSNTIPAQYDSCGYYTQKITRHGSVYYNIKYNSNSKSNTCSNPSYSPNYYTSPFYWVYTDTVTHQVIKVDTISSISTNSQIRGRDIIPLYGNYTEHPITIPVKRTLYFGNDCELASDTRVLVFKDSSIVTGGNYEQSRLVIENNPSSGIGYCCAVERGLKFRQGASSFPMSYYGDNLTLELYEGPLNNKYNFTAHYNQLSQQWTVIPAVTNTASINFTPGSLSGTLIDSCFPSGVYKFRLITACDTKEYSKSIKFNSNYEYLISEEPSYELNSICSEMFITPRSGRYEELEHNVYTYTSTSATANQPYTKIKIKEGVFQIIDGPAGGYTTQSVGLGGQLRVSLPGQYVLQMRAPDDARCDYEFRYDTIYFSGGTVEYQYDYAYVCDSTSTTGIVRVKGKNGTTPYIYKLYSGPDLSGNLIGENQTGSFDDVPLRDGQEVSVQITDSCSASFHINFRVFDLTKVDKSWFTNGAKLTEACEGSHITIYAIGKENIFSYIWTGPNGFTASTQEAHLFVPRGLESGYYKVELMNTGCAKSITDSVYVNVARAPMVSIADDAHVCPGETVTLTYTANGTGNVHYTIGHEERGSITYQEHTNSDSYSYNPTSPGIFWVHEVRDDKCIYSIPEDTVTITLKPEYKPACNLSTNPDTVCPENTARVSAHDISMQRPVYVKWYDDASLTNLLRTDTVRDYSPAYYDIPNLQHDTTLYVTASNDDFCESRPGLVLTYMNMGTGSTMLPCGESIRLYDSGGPAGDYSQNENIIHTFTSTDGGPVTLTVHDFVTEYPTDRLVVYNGASPHPDSVIATLSGDLSSSLPEPIVSTTGSMTLHFISDGVTQASGWNVVMSNNDHPVSVTASVHNGVNISLNVQPDGPVHNGDTIYFVAHNDNIAPSDSSAIVFYVLETSSDLTNWNLFHETTVQNSHDAVFPPYEFLESPFIRVIATPVGIPCDNKDTAHLALVLIDGTGINISTVGDSACLGNSARLSAFANVPAPKYFEWYADAGLNNLLKTDTVWTDGKGSHYDIANLQLNTTLYVRITSTSYYHPDLVASATATLKASETGAADIVTTHDTVCYDQTASLTATSSIPCPQYYNWWDNTRTVLLHSDTVTEGDVSHFNPTHQIRDSVYYVDVYNDDVCPYIPAYHADDPTYILAQSTVTVRSMSVSGTFTCPPDTTVELAYGACDTLLGIGHPTFNYDASLGSIAYTITHNAPVDSIYSEGTTVVIWTLTDECGTTYNCSQNVVVVYPPCGTPLDSVADYDGHWYSSVRIGCQCWTGENLRSTHYSDGTPVANYHYYQMNDSLENLYGMLYSWYSAARVPEGDDNATPAQHMSFFGPYVQGICPEGWALPTLEEYRTMLAAAGGTVDKVKEASTLYWLPGKEGTLPNSRFNARGAGYYDQAIDRYLNLMGNTYFWTSDSPLGSSTASSVEFNHYCDVPIIMDSSKDKGFSIRCVRKSS